MRYQLPQFIDIEDRIFVGMTAKQFGWILLGVIICIPSYFLADMTLFIAIVLVVMGPAMAMAFIKPNGRTMTSYLTSVFKYFTSPKLYIWQQQKIIKKSVIKKKNENYTDTPDFAIMKNRGPKSVSLNRIKTIANKLDSLELTNNFEEIPEKENVLEERVVINGPEAPDVPYGFGVSKRPLPVNSKKTSF